MDVAPFSYGVIQDLLTTLRVAVEPVDNWFRREMDNQLGRIAPTVSTGIAVVGISEGEVSREDVGSRTAYGATPLACSVARRVDVAHPCEPRRNFRRSDGFGVRSGLSGCQQMEFIAVGIGHEHPPGVFLADFDASRSERHETVDL